MTGMGEDFLQAKLATAVAAVASKGADVAHWAKQIDPWLSLAKINAPTSLAAFIGCASVESWGLTRTRESMVYSTADRIRFVWPTRFLPAGQEGSGADARLRRAEDYVRSGEALANYVYAHVNGNGDEASGDGWRFRGAGLFQLTGRGNAEAFGKSCRLPAEEAIERAATDAGAVESAVWYFASRKCMTPALAGNFSRVAFLIAGSEFGRKEHVDACNKVLAAISGGRP